MAKKTTGTTAAKKAPAVEPDAATTATPVKETKARATSVPKKAGKPTATTTEVTQEMIAERAYHLWKAGHPGSEHDHWHAAERELRGGKQ